MPAKYLLSSKNVFTHWHVHKKAKENVSTRIVFPVDNSD